MDTVVALVGPVGSATLERVNLDYWFHRSYMHVVYRYTIETRDGSLWFDNMQMFKGKPTYVDRIQKCRKIIKGRWHNIVEFKDANGHEVRFLTSKMRNEGQAGCSYSTPIVGGHAEIAVGSCWVYDIDYETMRRMSLLQNIARRDIVAEMLLDMLADESAITYDD